MAVSFKAGVTDIVASLRTGGAALYDTTNENVFSY